MHITADTFKNIIQKFKSYKFQLRDYLYLSVIVALVVFNIQLSIINKTKDVPIVFENTRAQKIDNDKQDSNTEIVNNNIDTVISDSNKTYTTDQIVDKENDAMIVNAIVDSNETTPIATKNKVNNSSISSANTVKQKQKMSRVININTASLVELQTLDGIGPALAKRIIEYRNNSKFQSVESIKNVSGIGDKKFEKIKNFIRV